MQAGGALLGRDAVHQLRTEPMDRTLRHERARSVERVETMIEWRERYG